MRNELNIFLFLFLNGFQEPLKFFDHLDLLVLTLHQLPSLRLQLESASVVASRW